VSVSAKEVALSLAGSFEMRADGCIHKCILRREVVLPLIVGRVVQNRCAQRYYLGTLKDPGAYCTQIHVCLLSTSNQQIGESAKSLQLSGIGRGPSYLPELNVKLIFHPLALPVMARERLVWFGQTKSRHYKAVHVLSRKV
jgi:hypothetical protein